MIEFDIQAENLALLLHQANAGDTKAYQQFLQQLAPIVRRIARRSINRIGTPSADLEDAVQETLLAIHLKRHTWRQDQPIGPWIGAITRYKLIDLARRHGKRKEIELDDTFERAAPEPEVFEFPEQMMNQLLESVSDIQREIVLSISTRGQSVHDVAVSLNMTEGAVRVALHRALKTLAKAYRRLTI